MKINSAIYLSNLISEKPKVIKATTPNGDLFIPIDPDNTDYQEILEQVKAGTLTIKDAD